MPRLSTVWHKSVIENIRVRPRAILLGMLSLTLVAIFLLVDGVVLQQIAIAPQHLPMIDLLLKLSLVAALLSFGLFALELRYPTVRHSLASGVQDPWSPLTRQQAFQGVVEAAIRGEQHGVVVLLSIDGVPEASGNGSLGPTLEKEMALRLIEGVPSDAEVAHWSPSKFAVMVPGAAADAAKPLADALVAACRDPVSVGVRTFELTCHAGVAVFSPDTFERSDQALHTARVALESAKRRSKTCSVFYAPVPGVLAVDREQMVKRFPRAIYDRQLEVYLQPRIALAGQRIIGFEALTRWSVDGRLVQAQEIVEIAGDAGMLVELDAFMLDEAVRIMADWNRRRKTAFTLSVNLFDVHFLTPTGTAFIAEALQAHRFPADLLTIEVAETSVFTQDGKLAPALVALRETGCRLSVDDFGAGHAPLSDLRTLSADEIKIDGRLLTDLEDSRESQAILAALLQMTNCLKIETIAEGVERVEQADTLLKLGCSNAQGFLFGHPRPALEWLSDATFGKHDEVVQRIA